LHVVIPKKFRSLIRLRLYLNADSTEEQEQEQAEEVAEEEAEEQADEEFQEEQAEQESHSHQNFATRLTRPSYLITTAIPDHLSYNETYLITNITI
jgi:hypothetical protein